MGAILMLHKKTRKYDRIQLLRGGGRWIKNSKKDEVPGRKAITVGGRLGGGETQEWDMYSATLHVRVAMKVLTGAKEKGGSGNDRLTRVEREACVSQRLRWV